MSITTLLAISLGAILTNNFIFSQFLGICPFLGVSKKLDTAVGMGAAVVTTVANCLPLWLDSVIYDYYFPGYILGSLVARLGVGIATALIVAILAMSVVPALRRQGLGREVRP